MHLSVLLDMAAEVCDDRTAMSDACGALSYAEFRDAAGRLAAGLAQRPHERTMFMGTNSIAMPLTLFAAAISGTAVVPLNYRLPDTDLRRIAAAAAGVAVVDDDMCDRLAGIPTLRVVPTSEALRIATSTAAPASAANTDPDAVAVLLYTSGTTGDPKAAVLRHGNLTSYVVQTLEFAGAEPDEAALVSVPPYHIAAVAAVLSSLYLGRRLVYLPAFSAEAWLEAVIEHDVTHAMLVPTMLSRVLEIMERTGLNPVSLRHLSYGGGRMPRDVIEKALAMLPHTAFVNGYGLTETSSTITVLGPEDHRRAVAATDPRIRAQLSSVGRPHDGVEIAIRNDADQDVGPGETGQIWVRGDQVSGEYLGHEGRRIDGWFATNDAGRLDEDGYLYLEGRLDDVIVRGGENISPGEVEDALRTHPSVLDAAVIGLPDAEWGECVAAVVVCTSPDAADATTLRAHVRQRLRSTKVPEIVAFRESLPYADTGKLLRRVLRAEFTGAGKDASTV